MPGSRTTLARPRTVPPLDPSPRSTSLSWRSGPPRRGVRRAATAARAGRGIQVAVAFGAPHRHEAAQPARSGAGQGAVERADDLLDGEVEDVHGVVERARLGEVGAEPPQDRAGKPEQLGAAEPGVLPRPDEPPHDGQQRVEHGAAGRVAAGRPQPPPGVGGGPHLVGAVAGDGGALPDERRERPGEHPGPLPGRGRVELEVVRRAVAVTAQVGAGFGGQGEPSTAAMSSHTARRLASSDGSAASSAAFRSGIAAASSARATAARAAASERFSRPPHSRPTSSSGPAPTSGAAARSRRA